MGAFKVKSESSVQLTEKQGLLKIFVCDFDKLAEGCWRGRPLNFSPTLVNC
jgi:hypothetical protein